MESYITSIILKDHMRHRDQAEVIARTEHIQHAYAALAKSRHFKTVMEDLTIGVLLKPCETLQDEGERRLVLKIMKAMEVADANMQRKANE